MDGAHERAAPFCRYARSVRAPVITAYEHVGIRVTNRFIAKAFYEKLGFREETYLPEHHANEMVNEAGVYINLIFNGVKRPNSKNVLQDGHLKYPGVTHAAFVVEDMDALMRVLADNDIRVTEGPICIGARR